MADSPQMTKEINNAQSNPIDFLKFMGQLVQASAGNSEQQKQADSLAKQDQTQATHNAYQKGVNKALSEQGYTHGTQALQAGVDPNDIANHSAMSLPNGGVGDANGDQIDPSQFLAHIVAANMANQSSTGDTSGSITQDNSQNNQQQNPQQDLIKQQAMKIIAPATTILGKLFESAGFGTETKAKQLNNLASAQKITGQEPLQQSEYEKTALETKQKIDQALEVPLSQPELANNQTAIYGHQITAVNDMYQKTMDEIAKSNEEIKALGDFRTLPGKLFGHMPDSIKKKFDENALLHTQAAIMAGKMSGLAQNPPKQNSKQQSNKVGKYSFTK